MHAGDHYHDDKWCDDTYDEEDDEHDDDDDDDDDNDDNDDKIKMKMLPMCSNDVDAAQ